MAQRVVRFPPGFAWGTAASSHQSEGGNVHNDRWAEIARANALVVADDLP